MIIPYLPYLAIIGAAICAVFGIASVFDGKASTVAAAPAAPSVRRGTSSLSRWMPGAAGKARNAADERSDVERWLLQAGFDAPHAERAYHGIRIGLTIGLAVVVGVVMMILGGFPTGTIWASMCGGGLVGFLAVPYVVRRKRDGRQQKFREGLPDMLDLLLVCTEAGMGLDSALARVAEELRRTRPLIAEQLTKMSAELQAGRSRADALAGFSTRTGIEETISLVNLLVQSDSLGTSMAETLRVFSEDMRAHRLLKAEEQANTVTVKLTLVLAGLLLPSIFIAILAPIAFQIMAGFAKMGG